jgi:regulator of protease activity HflC (stomatin/prohibitin superfamily)
VRKILIGQKYKFLIGQKFAILIGHHLPNHPKKSMSHNTKLTQEKISDYSQAISVFSQTSGNTLPIVLVPTARSCASWFMFVPDGMHVIMQSFGKDVGVVRAGFQFFPPWYSIAFLVSKQSCSYNAPVKNCPTKDNIMVQVDLTIIFRITEPSKFVFDIGALKFDELLKAATEEQIRGLVRSTPNDKIYELRGSRASNFLQSLNKKFEMFGVLFSDATITNVLLPEQLAETLQKETTFDAQTKEEEKSHQYNLKVLNDNASIEMKKLIAINDRLAQDEIAKKERILIQKGQQEIEAQKRKQLAVIKAEEESTVMKYKAETELINAKIQGDKEAALLILRAEGETLAKKIQVDQEAQIEMLKAKAEVDAAQNISEALLIEAEAESGIQNQLKERRQFDLDMERLKALESLAKNGKIVISGEHGDSLIKSVVEFAKK